MRYVSAYILASMGAKHAVTVHDIENILSSVGVDCESEKAAEVIKRMHHKNLDDLIAHGSQNLVSLSASPVSAVSAPVPSADTAAAPAKSEAKKEEKKEEQEESDEDMGFDLFN